MYSSICRVSGCMKTRRQTVDSGHRLRQRHDKPRQGKTAKLVRLDGLTLGEGRDIPSHTSRTIWCRYQWLSRTWDSCCRAFRKGVEGVKGRWDWFWGLVLEEVVELKLMERRCRKKGRQRGRRKEYDKQEKRGLLIRRKVRRRGSRARSTAAAARVRHGHIQS